MGCCSNQLSSVAGVSIFMFLEIKITPSVRTQNSDQSCPFPIQSRQAGLCAPMRRPLSLKGRRQWGSSITVTVFLHLLLLSFFSVGSKASSFLINGQGLARVTPLFNHKIVYYKILSMPFCNITISHSSTPCEILCELFKLKL